VKYNVRNPGSEVGPVNWIPTFLSCVWVLMFRATFNPPFLIIGYATTLQILANNAKLGKIIFYW
jgi:hypothetical protein